MWAPLFTVLFVGLASCEQGWKKGHEYEYDLTARTLTGMHQVADQYAGVLIKTKLTIQAAPKNQLFLQVKNAQYAEIHSNLSGGWSSHISPDQLSFQPFPIQSKSFQVQLKNGVVDKMMVDQSLEQWEVNFMKGIVSQLQVDTQAQNLKKSKTNLLPQEGQAMGSYKTMEDSINGIYETTYDISPLPEYVLQSRPELAPLPELRGNGQFINIVKSRNFSNSEKHIVYRYGAAGNEGWKAGSNQMGNFLSRTSVSRIVISGRLNDYTIQSSVTEEKVLVAPHLHDRQKGIVVGQMNLTLRSYAPVGASLQAVSGPRVIENLSYQSLEGTSGQYGGSSEENSASYSKSSGSSSDSSSSSSEESQNENIKAIRKTGQSFSSGSSSREEQNRNMNRNKRETHLKHSEMKNDQNMQNENSESSSENSSSSSSSSSSESSQSSSEEYLDQQPGMDESPKIEFLNDFIGGSGSTEVDMVGQMKKTAQEVGKWVENPGRIAEGQKLSLFSLLARLAGRSNSQQLQDATEMLYSPYSKAQQQQQPGSMESQAHQAWLAFRDAVAQAGTGPALLTLRSWIDNGKVEGEEAAQLLAVLPTSARYPTTQYMNYFFEMIKSEKVKQQKSLNSTGIYAFTELVRKSQVDEESSRNRYTIHLLSKSADHGRMVGEKYIPYLESELEKAIGEGDSIKAQVYIRALGNTAHPQILAAFQPYLEGKRPISAFQRLVMLGSLDELARVHPSLARSVLYRLYHNQGEAAEVRTAAVMLLMKTNPPAQMLQRMAEMTNYDQSKQVNSAVKSAIESAAEGNAHTNPELTINARTAVNLLTTESYGAQFSKKLIRSFVVKDHEELEYSQDATYIQGQDSIYPKAIAYEVQRRIGGYNREPYKILASTSSAEELLNLLSNQFTSNKNKGQKSAQEGQNAELSYEKIRNMLNLQTDQQMQVEGNILVPFLGGKRFFTFDNHSIEQIPKVFSEYYEKFQKGSGFSHSKYYNQYSMEVGFPLATGLQFIYSLEVPTLVSLSGQLKADISQQQNQHNQHQQKVPVSGGINGAIQFTYSAEKRGKMGFVAPFNNQKYLSGVDKNVVIHLPVEGNIEYNPKEGRVNASFGAAPSGKKKQQVFYFGTSVYTAAGKPVSTSDSIMAHLHTNHARKVHTPHIKTHEKIITDKNSGYTWDIEMQGEHGSWTPEGLHKKIRNHDLISAYLFHEMDDTTANNHLKVSYNSEGGNAQVQIGLSMMSEGGDGKPSRFTDGLRKVFANVRQRRRGAGNLAEPSSYEHRREELLMNVRTGIQDADASVIDAYMSLQGKTGYSVTYALAQSPVSGTSRALLYYSATPSPSSKPTQVAVQVTTKKSLMSLFNYKQSLQADPTIELEGVINILKGSQPAGEITINGQMERSDSRKQFLENHPISEVCFSQMNEGNNIQPACRNATLNAYYLDKYNFLVKYKDIDEEMQQALYTAYGWARQASFPNMAEDIAAQNPQNQMSIGVRFRNDLGSLNVSLVAPRISAQFQQIPMNQIAIPLLVHNAKYHAFDLLSQKLQDSQPVATAVMDDNTVTTFNNKTYPIDLGDCYHVFTMYAPYTSNGEESQQAHSQQNIAVLVKQTNSNQKDVQIAVGNDMISLEPSESAGVKIKINGEWLETSGSKVSRHASDPNIEAYSLPDKSVVISLPRSGLELIHGGSRLQLSLSQAYRNRVRGLAGTFDGEQPEDFTLPNNRVIMDPLQFAASYAILNSGCQGPAKDRQQQAQMSPSFEKEVIIGNVISDKEAGRGKSQQGNSNMLVKSPITSNKQQSCTAYAVKTVEDNGRTCFSIRPQVTCRPSCKASKNIEKTISFHCMQHSPASRRWQKMIKDGSNPDFTSMISNLKLTLNLPEKCVPN